MKVRFLDRDFVVLAFEIGVPVCFLVAFTWFCLRDRQYLLVDDAYIAFRYAANFADGQGLVWNPGERVEGYSDPLWVLLLAVVARFHLDLTVPAVVANLGFAVGCIALLWRISREALPADGVLTGLLAPLLLAGNPSFANASANGMESTCFGFFVLLSVFWLVRGRDLPLLRGWAALALCAAYLTRPEGALVAGVALLVELTALPGPFRARVRVLAPVGATVAALVAVHVAFRWAYYGYPLPNTFYAKVIFGRMTMLRGAAHIAGFLLAGGALTLPGVLELKRPSRAQPFIIHGYCLLSVYCAYLFVIGGDFPYWYRFYIPLLPLPLLATSQLTLRVGAALHRRAFAGVPTVLWQGMAVASAVGFTASTSAFGFTFGEHRSFVGHLDPGARTAINSAIDFFRREVPRGSVVAAEAVGGLGYYHRDLYIVDMWGLNNAHIAHLDRPAAFVFGHDKSDPAYVAALKPDYLCGLRASVEPPVLPGYDLCWPSEYYPVTIYRRNYALNPDETELGVPPPRKRFLAPPPRCRPPASIP
jgi:arabinofuranosyltransferase